MNDAAWERLTDMLDLKFGLSSHGRRDEELEDDHSLKRHIQYVCWTMHGTEFKAERVEGPALIERKTLGSRRAGSEVRFQNIYDPNETSRSTHFYRKNGADWEAIDAEELAL